MFKPLLVSAAFAAAFAPAAFAQDNADPAPSPASADSCETRYDKIDEMMRKLIVVPLDKWSADGIGNLGSHKVGMMIDNLQRRVTSRMSDQEVRILADVRNIRAGKGNMTWEKLKTSTHYSFHETIGLLETDSISLEDAKPKLTHARTAFVKDAVDRLLSFPARAVECGAKPTIS